MEIYIPFRLAEICLLMESKKYEFLKTVFLMACLLYIFSAIKALQSYRLVVGTIWGMIFDKYCRFFTEFNGFRFTFWYEHREQYELSQVTALGKGIILNGLPIKFPQ